MEIIMTTEQQELLVWSRPELQRLTIHVDTAYCEGSDTDFEGGDWEKPTC